MTDIASLGIKISTAGVKEAKEELKNLGQSTNEAQSAIDKMIAAIEKQNIIITKGKFAYTEYKMGVLGARDAEIKYAQALNANIEAHIKAEKSKKEAIANENKRKASIDSIINSLKQQEARLSSGKAGLTEYKLALLGASDAEKKMAKALAEKIERMEESNKKTTTSKTAMLAMAGAAGAAAAAIITIGRNIASFASSLLDTAKIADNFKYSLQAVSSSNEEAAETYKYLRSEADRLGQSVTSSVDSFTGFMAASNAAGLSVEQSKKAYTGLNEAMTALHRSPEQAGQALYALQQMLSTGTVRAQELNIQLGNAIPGAVPMFAKAMGKTTAELRDLMQKGLVPANEAVIKFTDYLSNKFAPIAEEASNSVQGNLNKMANASYDMKKAIVEAMGDSTTGVIQNITKAFKDFTEALQTQEGKQFISDLAVSLREASSGALTLAKALGTVLQYANLRSLSATMEQAVDLSKKGMIDIVAFSKATALERQRMVDNILSKEKDYQKTQKESIRQQQELTDSIIETNKALKETKTEMNTGWQPIVGIQAEITDKMKENEKTIKDISDKMNEQAIVAGKTGAAKVLAELEAANATDEEKKSIMGVAYANEAKEKAAKATEKAAREAEQAAESARKKAEAAEKARQGRINSIINKLKEQIATYQKGTEVSAEYQLQQEHATPSEIAYAKALGVTIDEMKKKAEVQKEFDDIMSKTAPDQIEVKRAESLAIVNEQLNINKLSAEAYAEAIARVNTHFDKIEEKAADKSLKELTDEMGKLSTFDGSSFGNTLADGINNAMISMNKLNDVYEKNAKIQEDIAEAQKVLASGKGSTEEREKAIKAIDTAESKMIENQISGYRQLFGTTSQLFKENSKERKALHNIEMAFAAAEIAMNLQKTISAAYTAITTSATADPYTAFARVAAMTALMAGIVAAAGGSLSGGSSSGSTAATASGTASSAQSSTALGSTEGSSSVSKSFEFLMDIEADQYNELRDINNGVEDLNKNITGLVTSIVRTGAGTGDMGIKTGVSGGTSTSQDMATKYAISMGTAVFADVAASITKNIPVLGNITAGISDWIDDTTSSISGALFGGSKKITVQAQGFEVSTRTIGELLGDVGTYVSKFADVLVKKSGGLLTGGGSSWTDTIYQELTADEQEIENLFTEVFKNMSQTIVSVAEELNMGEAFEEVMKSYEFDIGKIDLKGLDSDAINEKINEAISAAGDTAIKTLFGELISQYQEVGEGLLQTAIRVVSERAVVLDILDMTEQGFKDSEIASYSLEITQSIIGFAGSIKDLQDISSKYYDKFFTDEEKNLRLQSQLSEILNSMGKSLPETRDGLRSLIEGIDLTTEAGQQGYVTLLGLSESFDSIYSKIEADNEKKLSLELEIMKLTGKEAEALAIQRQKELDTLSDSNKILQQRIWAIQDESTALQVSEDRKTKIATERQKAQTVLDEKAALELQIMKLTGHEAEALAIERAKELQSMDDSLKVLQKRVWELEDLKNSVEVDYKSIAEVQKQYIRNIVQDGVKTFEYLIESSKSYGELVLDLNDKSISLEEQLERFGYVLYATTDAATQYKEAILNSIKAIKPNEIFSSLFEDTNTNDTFASIDNFVANINDRLSVFGDIIKEAEYGVQSYYSAIGDINEQYMMAQKALNDSVYLSAEEQAKVAEAFFYTTKALAQTSSEMLEVKNAFDNKKNMQTAISESLDIFQDTIIKKAGESIVPVIELNISKELFTGLVSSGALDKVAASIANVTEGGASEFQAAYGQLIMLLTEGTITTEEFNSVFGLTKDIFTGAIEPVKTVTEDLEKRFSLEMEILRLTGKETEAIRLEREKELAALGDTLRPLQEKVWLLQDEKIATELVVQAEKDKQQKEKEILEERAELTIRLLQAEGKDLEVLAITRAKERLALDETNRVLYDSIILLEDKNKAEEALIEAQKKAEEERIELQKKAEEEKKALLEKNLSESEDMLKKSIDNQISFYQTMADEANRIFDEAKGLLERSFTAEQETITKKHETLIAGLITRLEEAQTAASDLESVFNSLSDARKGMESDSAGLSYKAVQKQLGDALSMAKSGDISGAKGLIPNLGILTSQGAEKYGSQEEFKRDFFKTYNALSELEKLTGTQLTEQQQIVKNLETQISQADENNKLTLEMLQSQYDAVIGVDKTVNSFEDAVRQYQRAQYDANGANTLLKVQTELLNNQLNMLLGINSRVLSVDNAVANFVIAQNAYNFNNSTALSAQNEAAYKQLNVLYSIDSGISAMHEAIVGLSKDTSEVNTSSNTSTVPAFANGGYHSGGLRIVGEVGPEMEYTPPANITSNNDLKSIMSNEEVVAELKAMRLELARAIFELVKNSDDSKKTLREWKEIGIITRSA